MKTKIVETRVTLRLAVTSDAPALGRVHVVSWQETYTGIIPDQMLAAQSVEGRTAMWKRILSDEQAKTTVYLAERSGVIVGFGSCGAQRTEQLSADGYDAEIEAIYVLQSSQGRGVGKALMHRMACDLVARGYHGASLWVVRENERARRFYERLSGAVVAEREDERSYGVLNEVAYGWRNLDRVGVL